MKHNLNCLYLGKDLKEIPTQNYFSVFQNSPINNFIQSYMKMSPEEIYEMQNVITDSHAEHEMNFQVRDESGLYSKIVATPFHGFAPLPKDYVCSLVKSTQPVLHMTRRLLQKLYSSSELSLNSLDIPELNENDKKELISIIKHNIYYEPKYHNPVLKDYPFLCVVGFDSAIQNLEKPEHIFFELNAGTPCGIEDQSQLFQRFSEASPLLYNQIAPYLDKDISHQLLKNTIDSCALNWTKQTDGISVVLSPGPYNPAHPEIANLALKSGMPLVKMQDLYIDSEGYLRLITDNDHPKITGIYNRKEESFFTYSQELQIPLRSPFTQINEELSRNFNLDLKEGILYSYQYDQNNQIIGVDLNEDGEPKFQILFDSIAHDPQTQQLGSIMQAIWNKKLFVSNLGGRVFDDKRAFRIIANALQKATNNPTAHPPHSIPVEQLAANIQSAVVKAPDLSGGAGVTIMAQIDERDQQEVLSEVIKKPEYFEIQQLTKLAVITSMHKQDDDINARPLPVDWRLIIFFGPDNDVQFSTHSCLVRTAPFGSIKTNTSAGGGYALALIFNSHKHENLNVSNFQVNPKYIGVSRQKQLQKLIKDLKEVESIENIEHLIYEFRDLIDLIGNNNITFLQHMRSYQQSKINLTEFKKNVEELNLSMN